MAECNEDKDRGNFMAPSRQDSHERNMCAGNSTYQRAEPQTFLIYLAQISGCLFFAMFTGF